MYSGKGFEDLDSRLARQFVDSVGDQVHVIYLGGLLPQGSDISAHLRSRARVGEILRSRGHTTEFRAGPVVGSGSASFEMVRYLTQRLPLMITPRWIHNPVQTISIQDTLNYLVDALEKKPMGIVEVGSSPVSFKEMMLTYARLRGLKRIIIPTPLLAPRLAGHWVGLITPVPNSIARPLIRGITRPVLADTRMAVLHFPNISPLSYAESVKIALEESLQNRIESRWCDALQQSPSSLTDSRGIIREVRIEESRAKPARIFEIISELGGNRGWLVWNWAWRLRGMLDRLAGGPGLRRGRRHPRELRKGDAVDFWRVEDIIRPKKLRLRAEMRLPGEAWLQWEILTLETGSRLVQTALFAPRGLFGVLYWTLLYPAHKLIFPGLTRSIIREAELSEKTRGNIHKKRSQ
jgi:uncharacterized protein YbjT (DUF2867 family)